MYDLKLIGFKVLSILATVSWLSSEIRSEDWPGWGGTTGSLATNSKNSVFKNNQLSLRKDWAVEIGSGYSSVSVSDGFAVTGSSDGANNLLLAFDSESGEKLWSRNIGPVYKGHTGSHDGPISTPLIALGKVFMLDPGGKISAFHLETGTQIWTRDLMLEYNAVKPHYGFGSSPLIFGNILILQGGGEDGKSISGFDAYTGEIVWSSGTGRVEQQSPIIRKIDGTNHLICLSNNLIEARNPEDGSLYWDFKFDGSNRAIGPPTATIASGGDNQFLFKDSTSFSRLIKISREFNGWNIEDRWRTRHLQNTYVPSLYNNGLFFGYNTRILCCVDERSGELLWRSRSPGDGFLIVVDEHLIVVTKQGKLSVAPASASGYFEKASLHLFDDLVWAPPSFADNKLYVRSLSELACVSFSSQASEIDETTFEIAKFDNSIFGKFINELSLSENKGVLIDEFLNSHTEFPIIENEGIVNFVYRGDYENLSISSPIIGDRIDRPMINVNGTDFYYYSVKVPSDARVAYTYYRNFYEPFEDPLNPSGILKMPNFITPDFLSTHRENDVGSFEQVSLSSEILGRSITLNVYFPSDYSEFKEYPVVYFNDADPILETDLVKNALDDLVGSSIEEVVCVFIPSLGINPVTTYEEYVGSYRERYTRFLIEELIPMVEEKFSINDDPYDRSLVGYKFSALSTLHTVLKFPNYFKKIGLLNIWWDKGISDEFKGRLPELKIANFTVYNDWASFAYRSPNEGTDTVEGARSFDRALKQIGVAVAGREYNQGGSWQDSIFRLDALLETLCPMQ